MELNLDERHQSESGRLPVLLWKHFRIDRPMELARACVGFTQTYGLSAVKVMPDIPLLFEDFSITSWRQLRHLRRLPPAPKVGRVWEYAAAIEEARRLSGERATVIATIFSPLGLVGVWGGPDRIAELARDDRAAAHSVLGALAGFTRGVIDSAVEAGADAIYYSCWGQDILSDHEYRELGVPYDLQGLGSAGRARVRLLHVHGALDQRVDRYASYPVEVVGWSQLDSRVALADGARALPGKWLMGALPERPDGWSREGMGAVRAEVNTLRRATGGRMVLAPGCSLPDDAPDEVLKAFRAMANPSEAPEL